MKVSIEEVQTEIKFGSKGPLIRIRDEQGKNVGKLWIGHANIRWAKGNIPEKNAKSLPVEKFVKYLDSL